MSGSSLTTSPNPVVRQMLPGLGSTPEETYATMDDAVRLTYLKQGLIYGAQDEQRAVIAQHGTLGAKHPSGLSWVDWCVAAAVAADVEICDTTSAAPTPLDVITRAVLATLDNFMRNGTSPIKNLGNKLSPAAEATLRPPLVGQAIQGSPNIPVGTWKVRGGKISRPGPNSETDLERYMRTNPPKITVELVPSTCWWSNLRSYLTDAQWRECRRFVLDRAKDSSASMVNGRVTYHCEACGAEKHSLDCHEIWLYDDHSNVQQLIGPIGLCKLCHQVKHAGLALVQRKLEDVIDHMAYLNDWPPEVCGDYLEQAFVVHERRSEMQWALDCSWLEAVLGIEGPDITAAQRVEDSAKLL